MRPTFAGRLSVVDCRWRPRSAHAEPRALTGPRCPFGTNFPVAQAGAGPRSRVAGGAAVEVAA
ncbi:hypothetical protein [Amycolatopsis sp. ATCC 39116]|uniref:hypothetical protein n=1 Tax=Amycolatopsis sp. (strain ATCC 39116 / 75iv2) TaxID=385957 RepID=UPI0012F912EE|nr:hypothetical protein [Amycolatopsis sp. ATCC 39116]